MAPPGSTDRRAAWLAAAVLITVVVGGVVLFAVAAPERGPRRDRDVALQEPSPQPHIIPRPDEGHAPTQPGDRGGWEQLATLAIIVLALVVIGGLVWRSSRRARRRMKPAA